MKRAFLRIATLEFEEAVAYFNQQSEGLGYQFAIEVQRALDRIAEFPGAWPVLSKNTRRCRLRRFPYAVIYRMMNDTLLVIAVMHLHRNPDTWRMRSGTKAR